MERAISSDVTEPRQYVKPVVLFCFVLGSRDGAVMRTFASHQCGPSSISGLGRLMWVKFVVGSHLC